MDLAEKTVGVLGRMLARAETSYALARGARLDKGARIESEKEGRARQRRDAIRGEIQRRTIADQEVSG